MEVTRLAVFKCDICQLEFEHSDDFVAHQRDVHGKDPDLELEGPAKAPDLTEEEKAPQPAQSRR